MAYKIAVQNHKGGVGKTILSVNLAATIAARATPKTRVLLVDLDTQGNASAYLYLSKADRDEGHEDNDLGRVLRDGHHIRDVMYQYKYLQEAKKAGPNTIEVKDSDEKNGDDSSRYFEWIEVPTLHVVPAYESLAMALDIDDFLAGLDLHTLDNAIKEVQDEFDYIIYDCPPTFNKLSRMALLSADKVIVPVKPGEFELKGLLAMYQQLKKLEKDTGHQIRYFKVVMNLLRASSKKHIDYLARIQDKLGDQLAITAIPLAEEITQSVRMQLPLAFTKKGDLKKAFMDIAKEVEQDIKRIEEGVTHNG